MFISLRVSSLLSFAKASLVLPRATKIVVITPRIATKEGAQMIHILTVCILGAAVVDAILLTQLAVAGVCGDVFYPGSHGAHSDFEGRAGGLSGAGPGEWNTFGRRGRF